jgi:hypothetical protein
VLIWVPEWWVMRCTAPWPWKIECGTNIGKINNLILCQESAGRCYHSSAATDTTMPRKITIVLWLSANKSSKRMDDELLFDQSNLNKTNAKWSFVNSCINSPLLRLHLSISIYQSLICHYEVSKVLLN